MNINFKLKIKKIALLLGDIMSLYFALFLTLLIRFRSGYDNQLFIKHLTYFTILFCIWLIIIFSFRSYETNKALLNF